MTNFPEIITPRIKLRQFTPNDLMNVYAGLSSPEVIKYYGVQFSTLEDTKDQLAWFDQIFAEKTGIWWALEHAQTGKFMGGAGFHNIILKKSKAEIGFWLLPNYWGAGYMFEACTQAIEYAQTKLNINTFDAYVELPNIRSKNLLRKLKFIHHKTLHNCEEKNNELISLDFFIRKTNN